MALQSHSPELSKSQVENLQVALEITPARDYDVRDVDLQQHKDYVKDMAFSLIVTGGGRESMRNSTYLFREHA